MVFHMKTTLVIPAPVFRALKRRAAEEGKTISDLATGLLRQGIETRRKRAKRPRRLKSFDMGCARANIADRGALYAALDAESDARLYGKRRK